MKPVVADPVPIFRRDIMSERIFIRMRGYLRISRRSGGEQHEHCIFTAGGFFCSREAGREHLDVLIKIVPTVFFAAYKYLCCEGRTVVFYHFHLMGQISVSSAYDCTNAGSVKAIFKVMRL